MDQINIINQNLTLILLIIICLSFVIFGIHYSKKFQGLNNYLVANRNVGTLSLTTSLVASALGTWILFGPASAATWGGIGAVIGYSLGTAFPLFILIYLGKKFRNLFPKGKTLIEVVRLKFGKKSTQNEASKSEGSQGRSTGPPGISERLGMTISTSMQTS